MLDLKGLLNQPEENYMDEVQLGVFKAQLLEQRLQLIKRIHEREATIAVSDVAADPADQSTIEEHRSFTLRILARERLDLVAIGDALERIANGSYGWCEDSGERIGLPRLVNNPTAQRCIEAQTVFESRSRHLRAEAI